MYPGLSLPSQRISVYYLVATVLNCYTNPNESVGHRLAHTFLCVAIANVIGIVAVLLPFPSLSISTTRARLDMVRRLLCLLLKTSHQAFRLNEEVHFSTMDQLLESLSENVTAIQSAAGFTKYELFLLHFDWHGTKHAHLISLLKAIQQQAELFTSMRVSLKRLYPNDTHHHFLTFLEEPLGELVSACIDLTQKVSEDGRER